MQNSVRDSCISFFEMTCTEGGAYYIASKLIRKTFRARDGNKGRHPEKPIPDYKVAEKLICEHFQVKSFNLLVHRDYQYESKNFG